MGRPSSGTFLQDRVCASALPCLLKSQIQDLVNNSPSFVVRQRPDDFGSLYALARLRVSVLGILPHASLSIAPLFIWDD